MPMRVWMPLVLALPPDGKASALCCALWALMIALAAEASQRQQAETRIEQLAWYDPLTGLPNRHMLGENLRDAIMTCNARRRRLARSRVRWPVRLLLRLRARSRVPPPAGRRLRVHDASPMAAAPLPPLTR